jgi:hypothetical protein
MSAPKANKSGERGSPCLTLLLHKFFASSSIQKDRGSGRGQQRGNPTGPSRRKTLSREHSKNGFMLLKIKGLLKIKLEDDFSSGMMTLMKVPKSPSPAILDVFPLMKPC